jgi:hypothetical protein
MHFDGYMGAPVLRHCNGSREVNEYQTITMTVQEPRKRIAVGTYGFLTKIIKMAVYKPASTL